MGKTHQNQTGIGTDGPDAIHGLNHMSNAFMKNFSPQKQNKRGVQRNIVPQSKSRAVRIFPIRVAALPGYRYSVL